MKIPDDFLQFLPNLENLRLDVPEEAHFECSIPYLPKIKTLTIFRGHETRTMKQIFPMMPQCQQLRSFSLAIFNSDVVPDFFTFPIINLGSLSLQLPFYSESTLCSLEPSANTLRHLILHGVREETVVILQSFLQIFTRIATLDLYGNFSRKLSILLPITPTLLQLALYHRPSHLSLQREECEDVGMLSSGLQNHRSLEVLKLSGVPFSDSYYWGTFGNLKEFTASADHLLIVHLIIFLPSFRSSHAQLSFVCITVYTEKQSQDTDLLLQCLSGPSYRPIALDVHGSTSNLRILFPSVLAFRILRILGISSTDREMHVFTCSELAKEECTIEVFQCDNVNLLDHGNAGLKCLPNLKALFINERSKCKANQINFCSRKKADFYFGEWNKENVTLFCRRYGLWSA
ncbi:hypothetical protein BT69DRAFT_1050097 [Atractiella rhizophila]|nr:hypothetical protein BT69DRAFT_1050097 [Atractiella rhizophila]